MPNHIKNIVKMKDITALPLFEKEDNTFDFNSLIPMPEELNIEEGGIKEIAIEAVVRKLAINQKYDKRFVPEMNDQEYIRRKALWKGPEKKLLELGLQYVSNKIKYGAYTWYDWCIENWGTKWNTYENEWKDESTIMFETAWSNPEPIMLKLSERYPTTLIEHWWADENLGYNAGHRMYLGGKVMDGGYHAEESQDAYVTYIKCWGESQCLYQDKEGNWNHHDCEYCTGCNINEEDEE